MTLDYPARLAELERQRQNGTAQPGLDDERYRIHIAYGQSLSARGELDASWGQYARALELRPDDAAAREGQRQIVLAKNWRIVEATFSTAPDEAQAALEDILLLDPASVVAREKLYAVLIARSDHQRDDGDRKGAYASLMRALEVLPDGIEARQRLRAYTPVATPVRPPPPPPAPPGAFGTPVMPPSPRTSSPLPPNTP